MEESFLRDFLLIFAQLFNKFPTVFDTRIFTIEYSLLNILYLSHRHTPLGPIDLFRGYVMFL